MVFGLLLITIGFTSLAQDTTKIGYANVEFILSQLPEAKEIESDYKIYERQLSNQLQSKIDEFQQKAEAFQRDGAAMTELVRADKQNELRSLQASIEKFQSEAQISLQNKQIELFQPAYKRITETIQEVAEENWGFAGLLTDEWRKRQGEWSPSRKQYSWVGSTKRKDVLADISHLGFT